MRVVPSKYTWYPGISPRSFKRLFFYWKIILHLLLGVLLSCSCVIVYLWFMYDVGWRYDALIWDPCWNIFSWSILSYIASFENIHCVILKHNFSFYVLFIWRSYRTKYVFILTLKFYLKKTTNVTRHINRRRWT